MSTLTPAFSDIDEYANRGGLSTPYGAWQQHPKDPTRMRFVYNDKYVDAKGRNCFRTADNSLLPSDRVRTVVGETITVFEQQRTIYNDLVAAGLRRTLPITERIAALFNFNLTQEPTIDMEGDTPPVDLGSYGEQALPLLLMYLATGRNFRDNNWQMTDREMMVMYRMAVRLEKYLIEGFGGTYSDARSGTIQLNGFSNATGVNTVSFNDEPTNWVSEFHKIVKPLRDLDLGNIHIYVPTSFKNALKTDYKTYSGDTVMQRILGEDDIAAIKFSPALAGAFGATKVLAMSFDRRTIGVIESVPYTVFPIPNSNTGTSMQLKHIMGVSPFVRVDANNKTGVVWASGS